MGTPYDRTLQTVERVVASVANASEDSTLISAGANKTEAYRIANLTGSQVELQSLTNGAFVSARSQVDGDTGTIEIWGYPTKGDAEFLGEYTYTTDEMVSGDGYYYVDAWVENTAGQHTVTILNLNEGKAVLKFDGLGFKHIVILVTAITSSDADGIIKVFLRPW